MIYDFSTLFAHMAYAQAKAHHDAVYGESPESEAAEDLLHRMGGSATCDHKQEPFAPSPAELIRRKLEQLALTMRARGVKGQLWQGNKGDTVVFRVVFKDGPKLHEGAWCYTERAAFTEAALKWAGEL
jgi:hypothetical protein